MVIFHCDHYGTLSQMIVLRYKFHKDDETILLISQSDSKTGIYRGLEDKKIFDRVIEYTSYIGHFEGNKDRANQIICDYFDALFRENAIDLAAIDKVYISCDTLNNFGIFAYNRCIAYSMVEFSPGQLDAFTRYKNAAEAGIADSAYEELLRETSALTGDERLVNKYILVLPRPQGKNLNTHKRMLYIDFTKELSELPNDVKEKILSVYHVSRGDFDAIDTLVLPNSTGFLQPSGLPKEKYPYLYQLILDYYVTDAGNISVKTHPYGAVDYAGEIPGAASGLDGDFPIEFIALFPDVRIKNVVAMYGTSVDKIRPYVDNGIEPGRGYFRRQLFQTLHRLYAVYSLLESVGPQSIIVHHTRNFVFLQKYLRYVFPRIESKGLNSVEPGSLKGDPFTVVACCPPAKKTDGGNDEQRGGKDFVTVFFNGDNGFDFYDVKGPELLDQVIPIKITKTALRDSVLADLSDEYIYVFSKAPGIREKVRAFSLSKMLYYTGMEMKAAPLEDSGIDPVKMKLCAEDLETARGEIVNCLTEW